MTHNSPAFYLTSFEDCKHSLSGTSRISKSDRRHVLNSINHKAQQLYLMEVQVLNYAKSRSFSFIDAAPLLRERCALNRLCDLVMAASGGWGWGWGGGSRGGG